MVIAHASKPLADLRGMSNQEIFFIVYRGLHMQGFHKAMINKYDTNLAQVCVYYDPKTGRRCAAGQLFPGEKLPNIHQNTAFADLMVRNYVWVDTLGITAKSHIGQLAFIATLQRIHDMENTWVDPKDEDGESQFLPRNSLEDRMVRLRRYRKFAIEHKLIIPQNLPQAPIKDLYPLFGQHINTVDKSVRV